MSRVRLIYVMCLLGELLCYSMKKSSRIGHSKGLLKEIVLRFCQNAFKTFVVEAIFGDGASNTNQYINVVFHYGRFPDILSKYDETLF